MHVAWHDVSKHSKQLHGHSLAAETVAYSSARGEAGTSPDPARVLLAGPCQIRQQQPGVRAAARTVGWGGVEVYHKSAVRCIYNSPAC